MRKEKDRQKIFLLQITKRFPNDGVAEEWFSENRWPDGVSCPFCNSHNVSKRTTVRRSWRCNDCRRDFSTKTATLMQGSNLGFRIWAIAIYLLTTNLKGIASTKLASDLDITQKTAWHLAMRIRETYNDNVSQLSGVVEVDQTYIGGNKKNKHSNKKLHTGLGGMSNPSILELFAGAGGLALGIERAGLETVGLIEHDIDCVSTLRANRPNWNVIHSGVEDIDYSCFGNIDIISGGFPCQAFSSAGNRLGFEDKRGNLFFEMMRPVRELKPKIVLAENVSGLLSHNKGKTLDIIINTFTNEGYSVAYQLLNALNFGIAQKRKRLIIIAVKGDYAIPSIQVPNTAHKTIKDVLSGCPKSNGSSYSESKKSVLDLVPPGGCWTSLPNNVQRDYMGASYGHGSQMGGRRGMARRISWDEPSLTILCSPSQKQTDRCHPDETRPFTIRESARIQSFPDDWAFIGGITSQYRQIGNAVPVELAEAVAKHILAIYQDNFAFNKIYAA